METKLSEGLLLAEKRMLQEKAQRNESVVVQSVGGEIRYVSAKKIIAENVKFQ